MHVLAISLVVVVVASCSQPTASQLYLDLASASARSDLRSVEQLLERGADPDYYPPTISSEDEYRAESQTRPLTLAAEAGAVRVVAALLAAGADPSAVQGCGVTPLNTAISNGHQEIAIELLEAGADPGLITCDGLSPLELATKRGLETVVAFISGTTR